MSRLWHLRACAALYSAAAVLVQIKLLQQLWVTSLRPLPSQTNPGLLEIAIELLVLWLAWLAYGLFSRKGWAVVCGGVCAAISLLHCLSFLIIVGLNFGTTTYLLAWLSMASSAYVVVALRIAHQQTKEADRKIKD